MDYHPFADLPDDVKDRIIEEHPLTQLADTILEMRERTMERPALDHYFLMMAKLVSTRSTWDGTRVGCVVAFDKQVISTGYNGTPRGYSNHVPKDKKEYFCHAEENAIVQAARQGIRLAGSTFYCTISPCMACARMIVNSGAMRVVFARRWDHEIEMNKAIELLKACGLQVNDGD